jgi:GcrA cell cycle regulator
MKQWNDDCTQLLIQHHKDGVSARESALEIHRKTGVKLSRNAILGRRNRLGLCRSRSDIKSLLAPQNLNSIIANERAREAAKLAKLAQLDRRKAFEVQAAAERAAARLAKIHEAAPSKLCTTRTRDAVLALTANSCRYPIGTVGAEDFSFCCEEKDEGSPYCGKHRALCTIRIAVKV